MRRWFFNCGGWAGRAGWVPGLGGNALWLVALGGMFWGGMVWPCSAGAQTAAPAATHGSVLDPLAGGQGSKKKQAHGPAEKQPLQPAVSIPVGPLGFATPAQFYVGERFSIVSLNFFDEDNLLFAFRVPGLITREPAAGGQSFPAERHIRAVTIAIPSGEVKAESLWVLHDYDRFLWMMPGRRFLLRDKNLLQVGNASLHLEPFLRFPGPVNAVQLDASRRFLITDTTETPAPENGQGGKAGQTGENGAGVGSGSGSGSGSGAGNGFGATSQQISQNTIASSAAGSANMAFHPDTGSDPGAARTASQRLVRILSVDSRKVMLFSHANGPVHLPVDGEGYYEALRAGDTRWLIAYQYFSGQSVPVGVVESVCDPALEAMAPGIVVASACLPSGARHLTALGRNRDKEHARLWDLSLPPTRVWPQWAISGDGMRFARATLEVAHPIGIYSPLDNADIRGQSVQVYDLASGALALTVPASPILDGGGNFALSPSGRRLAVLNDGSIQIYDLAPVASIAQPMVTADTSKPTATKP